jgi:hypothetical protein
MSSGILACPVGHVGKTRAKSVIRSPSEPCPVRLSVVASGTAFRDIITRPASRLPQVSELR